MANTIIYNIRCAHNVATLPDLALGKDTRQKHIVVCSSFGGSLFCILMLTYLVYDTYRRIKGTFKPKIKREG